MPAVLWRSRPVPLLELGEANWTMLSQDKPQWFYLWHDQLCLRLQGQPSSRGQWLVDQRKELAVVLEYPCFTLKNFSISKSLFSADCTWSTWSSWSSCSKTCGSGSMTRSRTQYGPYNGGKQCSGLPTSSTSCQTNRCPGEGEMKNSEIPKSSYC